MIVQIGEPKICKENERTRMSASIEYENNKAGVWFEVDDEFGEFFTSERIDAYVLSLLPWAMMKAKKTKQSIILKSEYPISEKLWHQLTNYYIPILSRSISYYAPIVIETEKVKNTLTLGKGVGSSVSCGLDSNFTIQKYKDDPLETFRLTHAVYFDWGLYGDGIGSNDEKVISEKAQHITEESGLKFVKITSNIVKEFYGIAQGPVVPAILTGGILSLQKLFSVFHYSSANPAWEFFMDEIQACSYDLLNMDCFSTENTTFYLSGMEVLRLDKAAFVADNKIVQENLLVCLSSTNAKNCNVCANCSHTMVEFDVLDKLDLFNKVFDVEAFRKNPSYHWGYVYMKSTDPGPGLYVGELKEIIRLYKSKHGRIPFSVKWSAFRNWMRRGFTIDNPKRRLAKDEIR
ncbi:MAG: hypothetical protein FWD38_00825 [Oscillospiraceae bacterium]|nr:hypothetical protein [Oscillospiraceae bacterium]